ncbi:MAG: YkgJ family cysteine cluster protein [Chloroflexota bacterium]
MDCFRCGICCHTYQPYLSLKEARGLASWLGLNFDEFKKKYADPRWPGKRTLLLRKQGEACVFLERLGDGRQTKCRIHQARPRACRDWEPAMTKRECVEGLKLWGLKISAEGHLLGTAEARREFNERCIHND